MSGKRTSSPRRPPAGDPPLGGGFQAPDPAAFAFPDPFNSRALLAYYDQLRLAHGYIRFVSLPHLDDRPDVPIDRLYVPARLAERHVRSQEDPSTWGVLAEVLDVLIEHPHLVVLGDPGSGKSTLVSWVTWQLSAARSGSYPRRLGPLVPLPFVLRDLPLDRQITWDGLLDLFARQEFQRVAEEGKGRLSRKEIDALLATGQAFVLIDGLDEIGSLEVRRALRWAILEGRERYPGCRFLITSRIVGYDEVDLNGEMTQEEHHEAFEEAIARHGPGWARQAKGKSLPIGATDAADPFALRYAAPFDDTQIERFSRAWYSRFASESGGGGEIRASELVSAIQAHPATLALARVPILLTFIALIHRIEARLPNGRARLYGKIADAYLDSIDSFRRLQHDGGSFFSLEEKKRWLAFVAFRLQRRRAQEKANRRKKDSREILAPEEELVGWLAEAMERAPTGAADERTRRIEATSFLDYLARRSGLLLPRGEGRFAFAHLSIQEYFAAEHLRLVRRSRRWLEKSRTENEDGLNDLRDHAGRNSWTEVFFLLFELYSGDPEGAFELAEDLFGEGLCRIGSEKEVEIARNLAALLAQVSVDCHGGLDFVTRRRAWRVCWLWELSKARTGQGNYPGISRTLMEAEEADRPGVVGELKAALKEHPDGLLSLRGAALTDIAWIVGAVPQVTALDLSETLLSDLSLLKHHVQLKYLAVRATAIVHLEPLRGLAALERLIINQTKVEDLEPLRGLTSLQFLNVNDTRVSHLEPVRGLFALRDLRLDRTRVRDLEPLNALPALERLDLDGTQVSDLKPLRALTTLLHLDLEKTRVIDLKPLRGLSCLQLLHLIGTQVNDLEPLRGLTRLRQLHVSQTQVTKLEPLRGLTNLEILSINGPQISDVESLRALPRLELIIGLTDHQQRALGYRDGIRQRRRR